MRTIRPQRGHRTTTRSSSVCRYHLRLPCAPAVGGRGTSSCRVSRQITQQVLNNTCATKRRTTQGIRASRDSHRPGGGSGDTNHAERRHKRNFVPARGGAVSASPSPSRQTASGAKRELPLAFLVTWLTARERNNETVCSSKPELDAVNGQGTRLAQGAPEAGMSPRRWRSQRVPRARRGSRNATRPAWERLCDPTRGQKREDRGKEELEKPQGYPQTRIGRPQLRSVAWTSAPPGPTLRWEGPPGWVGHIRGRALRKER